MKHTKITSFDNGRSVIELTDNSGRTLKLIVRGRDDKYLGITFCDEHGEVDDWHITPEGLYDLLWSKFQKENEE